MTDPRCGQPGTAGYQAHRREGTEICQPCRDAYNAYTRARLHNDEKARTRHNRRKEARDRAKRRLAAEYPERYRQLVAEELRRDQQ